MSKLNGALIYVVAILVVAVVSTGAVLKLSTEENSSQTIITVIGFATMLTKGFFDSAAAARTAAALKETNRAVVETQSAVIGTQQKVEEAKVAIAETHQKVEVVREDVNSKMQQMLDEGRKSSYAAGVKDATDAQARDEAAAQAAHDADQLQKSRDAAAAQAAIDAAKVQRYEDMASGAAAANALAEKKAADLADGPHAP